MSIRGKLVKRDLGEIEGKPYGDIHVETESGNIVLKYPLGAKIDLPEIGSTIEVEFSGESIRTLEKLTLVSLPEKIDTQILIASKKEKPPARYPNAFWNKSYMGFGISTNPLDWIIMIALLVMGVIFYTFGDAMTYWTYSIDRLNLVKDTYIGLSFSLAGLVIVCGVIIGITKGKNLSTIASFLALFSGVAAASFWSSIQTSDLLITPEDAFAELYFYVCILIAILAFLNMLKNRFF
ncbi:MAG: hypothetical protein RTV31_08180 [Candidatus Thorarchaeota archaeon]